MKKPGIKEWLKRQWPNWRKKGSEEGEKLGEEFGKQVRRMLVGAIIALILVVLGFPRLAALYEGYRAQQQNPACKVFINLTVVEAKSLVPLDSVYVQVVDDATAVGYTDSNGELTLPYKADSGKNTIELTLSKAGYEEEKEHEVALPAKEGDSTIMLTYHLFPENSAQYLEKNSPKIIN